MQNMNALVALAYIRENQNPLVVFCNYIMYCLATSPSNSLRFDEISEKITREFGLRMPIQMMKVCLRILCKQFRIKQNSNTCYCIIETNLDLEKFDQKRAELKSKEEILLKDIVEYVKTMNVEWDIEKARVVLTQFLIPRENASTLFALGVIEDVEDEKKLSPQWYIGRYITKLLEEQSTLTDYLRDIVNGLMVYLGIYQIQDYTQERQQKFRGTDFYIDTKLLLRAMGYSWKLEIDAINELLSLITQEYSGNICVFEHTIGEIESALINAGDNIRRGQQIYDPELRIFAELKKCTEFDFKVYSGSVREMIEKKLHIRIQSPIEWSDPQSQKYNLNWESLIRHIQATQPNWKNRAITNDVNTIAYINILRRGNYSSRFGGQKRLPIFITSNSALVWCLREYIEKNADIDAGSANWNVSALPIVSDNMIMCRLWVTNPQNRENIPILTLARNAYAAQQENTLYFEKLRNAIMELKEKHIVDLVNLSEIRKEKLEQILATKTSGNIDEITPQIVASSVEELAAFENISLIEEKNSLEKEGLEKSSIIQKRNLQIIESASVRFVEKNITYSRIIICSAKYWWLLSSVLFGGICVIITPSLGFISAFVIVLIRVVEAVLGKLPVSDYLLTRAVNREWEKYSQVIRESLIGDENLFESEIIEECRKKTKIFKKNEKYIKSNPNPSS